MSDYKTEEELFKLYTDVVKLQSKYKISMDTPEALLIGIQTTGKSTLIEQYLGFPCNYVRSGVGTRRPIRYILHADSGQYECTISGIPVERIALADAIGTHMQELGDRFSDDPLLVEVWNAALNAVLTDLPGICDNDSAHKDQVRGIVCNQIRANKNAYLIIIVNSTMDYNTQTAVSTLKEFAQAGSIPKDWSTRSLVLGSFFESKLRMIRDAVGVQSLLDSPRTYGDNLPIIYYSLRPEGGNNPRDALQVGDKSKTAFDEAATYIARIPELEAKVLDEWKRSIPNWNPEWDKYFGINNVTQSINKLLLQSFLQMLPTLDNKLQSFQDDMKTKLAKVDQILKMNNPKEVRDFYRKWMGKYLKLFHKLMNGDQDAVERKFELPKYGHTMRDISNAPDWKHYLPLEEVEKQFTDLPPDLLTRFREKQYGGEALSRLLRYFEVLVSAARYEQLPASHLRNMMGGIHTTTFPNYEKAVMEGVKYNIEEIFKQGLRWVKEELVRLLSIWNGYVIAHLREKGLPCTLEAKLVTVFNSTLQDFTNEVFKALLDIIQDKTSVTLTDLGWQLFSVSRFLPPTPKDDKFTIDYSSTPGMENYLKNAAKPEELVKLINTRFPVYLTPHRGEEATESMEKYLNVASEHVTALLKLLIAKDMYFAIYRRVIAKLQDPKELMLHPLNAVIDLPDDELIANIDTRRYEDQKKTLIEALQQTQQSQQLVKQAITMAQPDKVGIENQVAQNNHSDVR